MEGFVAPKPLCFPGELRPLDAPPSLSPIVSPVGHDTCIMIIVHARAMIYPSTVLRSENSEHFYGSQLRK